MNNKNNNSNGKKGIPKYRNAELIARNINNRLLYFVRYPGGRLYCVGSRKRSGLLYMLLKDGVKLDELRRLKPSRGVRGDKIYNGIRYLLKKIDACAWQSTVG